MWQISCSPNGCLFVLFIVITDVFSDTPRKMYWIHTTTWILNIFAIFFILAAHEHYSIDVFIAFYLTSRLFLYYHSLANNRALTQGDRKRTRIWFPMFSYFESKVNGIVPNEYEWPIPQFVRDWWNGKKEVWKKSNKSLVTHQGLKIMADSLQITFSSHVFF